MTIAIDGRNGAGKSSLGRHLSWQLGMPVVETDLWLADMLPVTHWIPEIRNLILSRHERNRPVIVEGIMILQTLSLANLTPDFLVLITNMAQAPDLTDLDGDDVPDGTPCLSQEVNGYLETFRPQDRADFHLTWTETTLRLTVGTGG
jgi:hypothetical protein